MKNMKKPVYINGEEPLSKALNMLLDSKTAVFVVNNGKYHGLIDDRHIGMSIANPSSAKCINYAVKSPSLRNEAGIDEALSAFLSGKYKALPVLDENNKLLGMITKVELMKEMMENKLIPSASVSDFMKTPVFSIEHSSSIGNTRRELKNKGVHKLLVTDKGRPRGIVSTFDLSSFLLKPKGRDRQALIPEIKKLDNKPVSEVIRERIYAVPVDMPLFEAIKVMAKKELSNLLVMKGTSPIGVLSSTDVFKEIKSELKKKKWNISISGLNKEEDRQFYPEIMEKLRTLMKRYSKSFNIRKLSIHFKKKKSVYEARARMDINGQLISVYHEWHELGYLMDYLTREIKKVLDKKKSMKTEPKRSRRAPKRRFIR